MARRGQAFAYHASGGTKGAYPGTTSGYGSSRADSIGSNPMNPTQQLASQGAKPYAGVSAASKGTADWDGKGISPAIR